MTNKTATKKIIKDLVIVGVGVLVIWIGLQVAFGTQNPFYVVVSGSMEPVLYKNDVIVVQGHVPFEEIEIGDIIVFDRPSDHDRVIVHRVVSEINDDPRTLRTKGDNNRASIPGTDFPITEEEYAGKVITIIPQIGFATEFLRPPINYIIIAIVIGVMIVKQILDKKKKNDTPFEDPFGLDNQDTVEESEKQDTVKELLGMDKLEKDSEYSEHVGNTEMNQERVGEDKVGEIDQERVGEDKVGEDKVGEDKGEIDKKTPESNTRE